MHGEEGEGLKVRLLLKKSQQIFIILCSVFVHSNYFYWAEIILST